MSLAKKHKLKKILIIAEAGVNHNGNLEIAKKMVDKASQAGANYIKFQLFNPYSLSTEYANLPPYVKNSKVKNQLSLLKSLSLSKKDFLILKKKCKSSKIGFLASAFDKESLDFLFNDMKLKLFKIPSGEINNVPYLRHVGKFNKKIILSTGMSNIKEINDAIKILVTSGTAKKNISILQCNTDYPCPYKFTNLNVIKEFKKIFSNNIGFSDHTLGIEISLAAVGMGANIIEKHFTLNKNLPGPDHKASLDPIELKKLISSIRNIELSFGMKEKKISKNEKKNIKFVRKSIVANCEIKKGAIFTEKNLTTKRPGTGISPINWDNLIGKKSLKNYKKNQLI